MIKEAGAEDRCIDGLPGERVDCCPGEPGPRRFGQRRSDLPGRARPSGHTAGGTAVGQRAWIVYRQLAHPVSCPPAIGELAVTASSRASQGRRRASTWTPTSREGTPTCGSG